MLADVAAFLIDLDLHRTVAPIESKTVPAKFAEHDRSLRDRHQAVRRPLLTLGVSHPSPTVRRLARDLERSLSGCLPGISMAIHDPKGHDMLGGMPQLEEQFRRCNQLLTELVEKI